MTTARSKLICLVLLTIGGVASSQTVTPPTEEFRGLKAESSFRIDNAADSSMSVVLDAKSFAVSDDGKVIYSTLPSTMHVNLESSSFVIAPHDGYTVYYKATSTISPASFSIIPTMTPMVQTKGVRVNIRIPHMVYLYQKAKLTKSDVRVTVEEGKVIITNVSGKLGRVEFIHAGSSDLNGFPIYPNQTRRVAITGSSVSVHFEEGFKVDVR